VTEIVDMRPDGLGRGPSWPTYTTVQAVIVVDLGCFPHRDEISIEPLIERFHPAVLYGFDPWPALVEGETVVGETRVVLRREAAWIGDGEVEFARVRGLRGWDSTVMRDKNEKREWTGAGDIVRVPCFDFSAWLRELPPPPIVKLDVEGAEFPILEKLVADGTDVLVAELLVEWHDDKMPEYSERRTALVEALRCPVAPWEDAKTTMLSSIRGMWSGRRAIGARA
jgi:FkbM family methyltransferase